MGILNLHCFRFIFFIWFDCAGPVVAEAMFVNREEVPVYPIYRDPVSYTHTHIFWFDFSYAATALWIY